MAVSMNTPAQMDKIQRIPKKAHPAAGNRGDSGFTTFATAVLIAVIISAVYISFSFIIPGQLGQEDWLIPTFRITFLLIIGLCIPYYVMYYLLSRVTGQFFQRFYNPPEGTDSKDLILARLSGYGSRIPIHSDHLELSQSWLKWLGGPAGLIINDGFAVYLEKGNCFSRILGPGKPHLELGETVKAIIDLRPIIREGAVNAWTKDGIQIELKVRLETQIGHEAYRSNGSENLVYPFDPEDIQKAVEKTFVRVDPASKSFAESNWVDGVWSKVKGFLSTYISSHTVDELFLAEWGTSQMLSQSASRKVFQELNQNLIEYGARISNLQITSFNIPEEVNRQRIQTWEAERQSVETVTIGQTKAYEIREREKARAEAEQEIIANIAREMERIDFDRLQETILLSLSGILDQSLSDPFTRTLVTNETLDTLEKLKKLL